MVAIAVIVLVIVIARSGSNPVVGTNEPIKIGTVLPLTGFASNYGENQTNAIKLAVDEINSKGGVLGRRIELVSEDDNTDPKKSVSAFQKLVEVNKVPVVIGGVWDIMANAIMPLTSVKQVPLISTTASPDILEKTTEYFFTTIPPVSIHQSTIEKYLKNEPGKKVAIMYVNGGWGIAHLETYKKAIDSSGKTLVAESKLSKFDNNDIQREITLLKLSKPEIILAAVNIMDGKLLAEKNAQFALNARIFGHDNIAASYESQEIDKNAMKGLVVYRLALPQSEFLEKYKKAYGKAPFDDADKAYDAVYVIKTAIELSEDPSSSGILKGLKQVGDFNGASGPIDYTKANWPTKDTARMEIFDGTKFVPYLNN